MDCPFSKAVNTSFGQFWVEFLVRKSANYTNSCKLNCNKTENILEFPHIRPFTVAVWSGEGKPLINEFLRQFVDELQSILSVGVAVNGHLLTIKIKCFICDTPARSYLKGTH